MSRGKRKVGASGAGCSRRWEARTHRVVQRQYQRRGVGFVGGSPSWAHADRASCNGARDGEQRLWAGGELGEAARDEGLHRRGARALSWAHRWVRGTGLGHMERRATASSTRKGRRGARALGRTAPSEARPGSRGGEENGAEECCGKRGLRAEVGWANGGSYASRRKLLEAGNKQRGEARQS